MANPMRHSVPMGHGMYLEHLLLLVNSTNSLTFYLLLFPSIIVDSSYKNGKSDGGLGGPAIS